MVHLKYIDNPFDEKMMNSISCFSEERSFYDCVNRRFLNDQAFQHFEHSFYTYFLTGDSGEWIGYVLFSNENMVNGYHHFACEKMLDLLNDFRNKCDDFNDKKELDRLESLINENTNSHIIGIILEEVTSSLKQLKNYPTELVDNMIMDYNVQLQQYLLDFPEYFYLDVVIALPVDEELNIKKEFDDSDFSVNMLAEFKYYGFIREAFTSVEEEIKQNFRSIPILLREENKNIFLVNSECLSDDKKVVKQLQGIM